jgi:hypothetical protein
MVVVPLLLLTTLLLLAVGLLALLALVAVALMVGLFAWLVRAPLGAVSGKNRPPTRRPPGA